MLILTTFGLDEYVYAALCAGASGFMLKNVPPQQLAEAVRTVAGGDALLAPSITRRLIEEHVSRLPDGLRPERLAPLTARELEVLSCVVVGSRTTRSPRCSSSAERRSRRTSPAC